MPAVPLEANAFINRYQLGTPEKVYRPHTIASIIGGLFLIAFAIAWILFAAAITRSPLVPASLLPFQTPDLFPSDGVPEALGIIFPLFGLIFVIGGLVVITRAILNQHVRAILCTNGIVHLGRTYADAFRWEQVATVFHKVTEHTHTSRSQNTGMTSTSKTYSHTYTITCLDGRKFLFDANLGRVKQLGTRIEYEVARHRKHPGPYGR